MTNVCLSLCSYFSEYLRSTKMQIVRQGIIMSVYLLYQGRGCINVTVSGSRRQSGRSKRTSFQNFVLFAENHHCTFTDQSLSLL